MREGYNMDMLELLRLFSEASNSVNQKPNQYKEILKLDQMLNDAEIPHELYSGRMGGFQITYFGHAGKPQDEEGVIRGSGVGSVCSIIENDFSYGHENDLLEISGLMTDEEYEKTQDTVLGNLTADDVFERIRNHWLNN